jgi:hypothetical protein
VHVAGGVAVGDVLDDAGFPGAHDCSFLKGCLLVERGLSSDSPLIHHYSSALLP